MNTGVLVIGILVLIFIVVGLVILLTLRNQRSQIMQAQQHRGELEARATQAVWAGATIATARHHTSAQEMRESVRVDMTLQIQPPNGGPYTARTAWRVNLSLLPQFQPGQPLSVKIDRDDPTRIYPNQPGVEFWV